MLMNMGITRHKHYTAHESGVSYIFDTELIIHCLQAIRMKKEGITNDQRKSR